MPGHALSIQPFSVMIISTSIFVLYIIFCSDVTIVSNIASCTRQLGTSNMVGISSLQSNNTTVDPEVASQQRLRALGDLTKISEDVEEAAPPATNITVGRFFKYKLSPKMKKVLFDTLKEFERLAARENLQWFLAWGTLLGSYRHHDLSPWDDDIDVMAPRKMRDVLYKEFLAPNSTNSTFAFDESKPWGKLYSKEGVKTHQSWRSPFIDIFYYKENFTNIWGVNFNHDWDYVFPLVPRPFNGRLYPGPRDPRKFLERSYTHNWLRNFNIDQCETGLYDHMHEKYKPREDRGKYHCASFTDVFPFVTHVRGPAGSFCKEVLTFKGKVQGQFTRSAFDIPQC